MKGISTKGHCSHSRWTQKLSSIATLLLFASTLTTATDLSRKKPIVLESSGGFEIGGKTITDPNNSSRTLSCDHGYIEYFTPWTPRSTSLVMWHSSSTQVWQNRWDGGPGFKDIFLREDYPVYLWDGPRVGRANWACENVTYTVAYRDEENFPAWNFGPRYGEWWNDTKGPREGGVEGENWKQATANRYDEFDTRANVDLHSTSAAIAADSGRLGNKIVYLTNSAGGLRAQITVAKSQKSNIAGIVAYESIGYVYPDNVNVTDGKGGFGPFVVPLEDFKKLAKVKAIQFVWGDHRLNSSSYVQDSYKVAALINKYGGNAQVLVLGNDTVTKGNSHIPFADMNNMEVAGLLDEFLEKNGLDTYAGDRR
ncbi:hypothetical protein BGZ60DRAFT_556017 [Tricladium varicosporioides]|nr:hypothetical protein BGZ60DRAFT_556017 [Hymenoscyphus varicosporioides]